ncbi:TetR/AcrR family transcriptional regulator [Roseomonas hellenica]|uniref:TetR/AcrR family transcriptional regulator n=1 Tax=Plastoroseomonas hellenica TaxID=2687306 RepID=A0ABS5ERY7_9PROT|nr:TetR/AcrR family transcriptional regulator [Plastoroseomonas hellenica]MBR0663058.1 TetR/AcrR family transcriptional regulator [Plastoroseomonas hellenica]
MVVSPTKNSATSPRPRGRQPTFDRDQALEVALDLFWRHGYDGVSIADLTDAIGIAAPSLYHAFGNKADLYREVLRRYGASGISADEIAAAPSGHDAARMMLERGIAAVTTPGKPLGCMVSSGLLMTSAENAELAAELRAIRSASRLALERRITSDVEAGLLPAATDAAALARFIMTVLQGLSVQALDGASAAELAPVVNSALKIFVCPQSPAPASAGLASAPSGRARRR